MHSLPNIIPSATVLPKDTGAIRTVRYHSFMRTVLVALVLLIAPLPAMTWEFTPVPICTLFHQDPEVAVMVTYDPDGGEYAIHLSRESGWPHTAVFSMRFEGPRGLTISTTQHVIEAEDTRTLTVRDRGFGNVLNGLNFNQRAVAVLGDLEVPVSLDGAAPAVEEFRACPTDQLVHGTWTRAKQAS
ncbi:excinuclease ABC subunit B [Marivita sp. XM-24bin2]|uniref:excinuclease ABC subunit B n=1 Tax=unclassified Marivita TaxID=2632480 RepID=UPI0025B9679D|nr:excinuclease ABC subunit B [Marivita sp. XM-24bin2]MCR9110951.1 excinuclease ABC subunit B [Paracoccaceae bacterium]